MIYIYGEKLFYFLMIWRAKKPDQFAVKAIDGYCESLWEIPFCYSHSGPFSGECDLVTFGRFILPPWSERGTGS